MHQRLIRYLDVASIYVIVVLFGISMVDYVTIDQTKRVSGLTMLILIGGIIVTRLMARQQRQINALRGRLPRPEASMADIDKDMAPAAPTGHVVPPAPVREPSSQASAPRSDLPSNVVDFQRR